MGAMKEIFTQKQQEFAEARFIKDGCDPAAAKHEDWDSMVGNLYDGDTEAALTEFYAWYENNK